MITLPNANAAGCDSVITLNLIIKQPSFSTINITNCGEYTMNGTTYTSTGQYTQTLIDANAVGCESTITLNLNIVSSINYYQDLDNDGYAEPYIAVVHKASGKLVKLVKRFHEKDVKKNKKGEIQCIEAINFFVRYTIFSTVLSSTLIMLLFSNHDANFSGLSNVADRPIICMCLGNIIILLSQT